MMHRKSTEERIDSFFTTEKWAEQPVNAEPHKSDSLAWFNQDNLPPNMVPYVCFALQNYQNGIVYS
jgi:hypothetical protein